MTASPLCTRLTQAWLALAGVGLMLGLLRPPGLEGLAALRDWWTTRRFEQAAMNRQLPRMAALAEDMLREQGVGSAAEFAGYLMAWAAPSPSMGYQPEEAAALAQAGRQFLAEQLPRLPAPWASLQILSNSLVLRPMTDATEADTAQALAWYRAWLAAGGGLLEGLGPAAGQAQTAAAYRQYLQLPPEQAEAWLKRRLLMEDALAAVDSEDALGSIFPDKGQD